MLCGGTSAQNVPQELVLYENVDLRQVELPFNSSERIAAVLVQEGGRCEERPGSGTT